MTPVQNNRIAVLTITPTDPHRRKGDPEVNQRHAHDARLMRKTLKTLAESAEMGKPEIKKLKGSETTRKKILKWLDELKNNPPRVAICCFSGHGCAAAHHAKWPSLFLGQRHHKDEFIDGEEIQEKLRSSGVPLTVSFFEACNTKHETEEGIRYTHDKFFHDLETMRTVLEKAKEKMKKSNHPEYHKGAIQLFQKAVGQVGFTAAKRGQMAFAYRQNSIAIPLFAAALLRGCREAENASWTKVSESVQIYAKDILLQTPALSVHTEQK